MSRRYTSDGYDDSRHSNRRASRDLRHARDSGDTWEDQEQPITRDLREQRHPRDRGRYSSEGGSGERGEIRVARDTRYLRDPRDPRDPRDARDPTDNRDSRYRRQPVDVRQNHDAGDVRAHEGIATPGYIQDAHRTRRGTRETRYHQDLRQVRNEIDDPGLLNRAREDCDERRVRNERGHRIVDQSGVRNDFIGEALLLSDNPRDSRVPSADERMSSLDARDSQEHSIGQPSPASYVQRHLFERPQRVDPRADPHSNPGAVGHSPEARYGRNDRLTVHGSSGRGGSSVSQPSAYDSPSSGSRGTQWSSRSSYSTAPSSRHSISDERRYLDGQEVAQHPYRRNSTSRYSGSLQSSPPATQSYMDPRTGGRVTIPARPGRTQRPAPGSPMPRDDEVPDWDETPNFRRSAGAS